jgi:hypothetical protein
MTPVLSDGGAEAKSVLGAAHIDDLPTTTATTPSAAVRAATRSRRTEATESIRVVKVPKPLFSAGEDRLGIDQMRQAQVGARAALASAMPTQRRL